MSIFAGSAGQDFAERMCRYMELTLGNSQVIRFSDGNTFVRINQSVRDGAVYLVQPIGMAPNDEFVETLFWLDAFKRASARSVTLVMPYFGYAKGDKKDEPRVSIRARVCAESIELAGADRTMIMDLHSGQVQGFFKRPMDHLYALPVLAEYVRRMDLSDTIVVSPDAGYAKQARRFGAALKMPVAIGDKMRTDHSENAEVLEIIGEVNGKNALIVDDFTISGGTLVNLAKELKLRGVKRIYALLSHNIVSAQGVEKLENSPIELVVSTDTVANPYIVGHGMFKTLSVAPLFAETIMRYHNYQSINELSSRIPDE
ncbi:MAG: ribose-phosphate diphosphokinase, partial [Clostridiales bacterium]|nr:ribose-phosphate diphosphokinase [Clostridiales bacterium]